jgi:hypothetical protein
MLLIQKEDLSEEQGKGKRSNVQKLNVGEGLVTVDLGKNDGWNSKNYVECFG